MNAVLVGVANLSLRPFENVIRSVTKMMDQHFWTLEVEPHGSPNEHFAVGSTSSQRLMSEPGSRRVLSINEVAAIERIHRDNVQWAERTHAAMHGLKAVVITTASDDLCGLLTLCPEGWQQQLQPEIQAFIC